MKLSLFQIEKLLVVVFPWRLLENWPFYRHSKYLSSTAFEDGSTILLYTGQLIVRKMQTSLYPKSKASLRWLALICDLWPQPYGPMRDARSVYFLETHFLKLCQTLYKKMTWGRGRWPRDFRKLGWFSCAKHLEKSMDTYAPKTCLFPCWETIFQKSTYTYSTCSLSLKADQLHPVQKINCIRIPPSLPICLNRHH